MDSSKANEVLKSLKKIFSKKRSNKYHVSITTIANLNRTYQKANSERSKIIEKLRNDLEQVDDIDVKKEITVRFSPKSQSLKLVIPFLSYGYHTFRFKKSGNRIVSLDSSKFLLDNLIIEHAADTLDEIYNFFSIDFIDNKVSKPIDVLGTVFKVKITTNEVILYYEDFQIVQNTFTKKIYTKTNVRELRELVQGKESKIFNKAQVDIRKCPVWIQKVNNDINGKNQGHVKIHK